MKLVTLPVSNINDIPNGLRKLAEQIKSGAFGDAHNLAWIIDCGDSKCEFGMLGKSSSAGSEFYLLLALAQHRMIKDI